MMLSGMDRLSVPTADATLIVGKGPGK